MPNGRVTSKHLVRTLRSGSGSPAQHFACLLWLSHCLIPTQDKEREARARVMHSFRDEKCNRRTSQEIGKTRPSSLPGLLFVFVGPEIISSPRSVSVSLPSCSFSPSDFLLFPLSLFLSHPTFRILHVHFHKCIFVLFAFVLS